MTATPFLDAMSGIAFGRTRDEAWLTGTCIRCRERVVLGALPEVDRREYGISGLCPRCWDVLFPEDEEQDA